jgi:prolyl-tRNA synthetase
MGCYGIGIARTLATIVEVHNDDKGIIWPESVAPFMIHLVGINMNDKTVKETSDKIYKKLIDKGLDVLYDDRLDVFPGEKLSDADLIGIPHRVIVSPKTLKNGNNVEYMSRKDRIYELLDLDKLNEKLIS